MVDPEIVRQCEITTELRRMDLDRVHRWLSTDASWARGRSHGTVVRAAENSLNFAALLPGGEQVAYARVVTDHATFAWLCDVYVDPEHRGHGLGVRLADAVVSTLRPMDLTRVVLSTVDAHELYRRVGFSTMLQPEKWMQLDRADGPVTRTSGT